MLLKVAWTPVPKQQLKKLFFPMYFIALQMCLFYFRTKNLKHLDRSKIFFFNQTYHFDCIQSKPQSANCS
jgi:hypothetical protein